MDDCRRSEGKQQGEIARLQQRIAELEARLTERRLGPDTLDVDEQLLDSLTELIPTSFFVYQDDKLAYANRAAFETMGLDRATTDPSEITAHLDDEFHDLVSERAKARLRGESVPSVYEIRFTRTTGEKVWLLMRVQLIRFRGRRASLAAAIDITDRKQAEEELRASEASLAAIVENTGDYILLSDQKGNPVYFNSAYAAVMKRLLGLEMKPGLKPHTFLPDPKERAKWDEYHRRVLSGEQFTVDYDFTPEGADPIHLEVSYYPVKQGEKVVGFCEFTHDVTERKNNEARLAKARQERAAQLRQIAGGLSHEIHNALFPANTTLHKLREHLSTEVNESSQRDLRLLDLGLKSLQRAINLTESVRLFSKLDRFEVVETTDLGETIAAVLNQQYNRLQESHATISVDLVPGLRVCCPASHLYSVFDNLVVNAADALEESGGGNLTIRARREQESVVTTVTDDGPGIDPGDLEHVFEPFYTTKASFGTGLGLAIVRRIVDLCGGELTAESTPGAGMTFTIRLPVEQTA